MTGLGHLAGEVAVVSGAGSGIGEALARHASLRVGMTAVVADISLERAQTVADSIRSADGAAVASQVDVADWDAVSALQEWVQRDLRAPALLVCNAGVEMTGRVWETDARQWERVQAINVNPRSTSSAPSCPRYCTARPAATSCAPRRSAGSASDPRSRPSWSASTPSASSRRASRLTSMK